MNPFPIPYYIAPSFDTFFLPFVVLTMVIVSIPFLLYYDRSHTSLWVYSAIGTSLLDYILFGDLITMIAYLPISLIYSEYQRKFGKDSDADSKGRPLN
ncbi:MAG: hypothetical protein M1410_04535 [Candidatus Thermoplasmatota archaeon]|nr:hypothetical protein [Candidatus Thermoplasmatota archaeon]